MQSSVLNSINLSRFSLSPYFPKIAREMPISSANAIGPARSPAVLPMPSAFSAKVEAHWLTACSLAPAQSIRSSSTQKIFLVSRLRSASPPRPSSSKEAIGTRRKTTAFTAGRTAQISARTRQLPVPKS